MNFVLAPTQEPYGPSCSTCPLFADGECLGVSTVRMTIGVAQKVEESLCGSQPVTLSQTRRPAVQRSFRILENRMRYCPGPGNDGKGDFRESLDTFSGYRAAVLIRIALAQIATTLPVGPTPQLQTTGSSFMPSGSSTPSGYQGQSV